MNEKQQPEHFLQARPRVSLQGRNTVEARVIELAEPCEILEPDVALDLRAYAQIFHKRLSTILIVLFIVFVVVAIATLKQKPVYRAQVVLDIQKENPDIPTIQELYALQAVSDTSLRTQYSILASKSLARRVIDELHLDPLPELNAPKWWSWPRKKENASGNPLGTGPFAAGPDRDEFQRVLERFHNHLAVDPVNHSRLVAITFDSRDPNLAARVANTLAADFIEQNLQARWTATQSAADWLSQQLSTVKVKLEKSENELQAYARRNGLVFIQSDKGASENVADQRLQQLQEELTKAQAERYAKEALYRLIQAGDFSSLPGVFDNRMLQDLTERLGGVQPDAPRPSTHSKPD